MQVISNNMEIVKTLTDVRPRSAVLGLSGSVFLSVSRSKGNLSLRISFPLLLNDLIEKFKGILKLLSYSLQKVFISFLITDLFPQVS